MKRKELCVAVAKPVLKAVVPSTRPTAECLVKRLPQLQRFLGCRGFSQYVIERAIDRVIHAALPYLPDEPGTPMLSNHVRWLFASASAAARQVASLDPAFVQVEVSLIAETPASEPNEGMASEVWAALNQLTLRQRDAVRFCVMLGWKLSEAAKEMGCQPTTVLRHRNRGMDRLRVLLAERVM